MSYRRHSESPARTAVSLSALADPTIDERSGFFSATDSAAPKLPQAKRFNTEERRKLLDNSPGPGHYSAPVEHGSLNHTGGVIARADRYAGQREKFISRRYGDATPGPAAYDPPSHRPNAQGTFGRAARSGLKPPAVATGSHVGPGSYGGDVYGSPNRSHGNAGAPATFSRARRSGYTGGSDSPGPGYYTSSSFGNTKGGSFSRAVRTTPVGADPRRSGPSPAHYNGGSSFLSSKGGAIPRTGRAGGASSPGAVNISGSSSPGPGSYSPHYAATSCNVKLR
eukprot:Rhum_TRINITY_DN2576_c0_g1::Rhum_TRINITY_DN2576_c0_g1_i1::g.7596::m.7596